MKFPLLLLLFNVFTSESCSPGPRYGFRHSSRRLTPLVRGQFIPEVSETTIGASGPAQTPISENSAQFSKLVLTYNPDVEFTDNGEDANVHTMTQVSFIIEFFFKVIVKSKFKILLIFFHRILILLGIDLLVSKDLGKISKIFDQT